jgi:hypothetical protein
MYLGIEYYLTVTPNLFMAYHDDDNVNYHHNPPELDLFFSGSQRLSETGL